MAIDQGRPGTHREGIQRRDAGHEGPGIHVGWSAALQALDAPGQRPRNAWPGKWVSPDTVTGSGRRQHRHHRALPSGQDVALGLQLGVGMDDAVAGHAQFGGQGPAGRQHDTSAQLTRFDQLPQVEVQRALQGQALREGALLQGVCLKVKLQVGHPGLRHAFAKAAWFYFFGMDWIFAQNHTPTTLPAPTHSNQQDRHAPPNPSTRHPKQRAQPRAPR